MSEKLLSRRDLEFVLYELLELSQEHPGLELYMGNTSAKAVFHPKVYAFEDCDGDCCIVVGSANMTRGGLANNHELSALISAKGAELFRNVSTEIDHLIRTGEVVVATTELIEEYAVQHLEYAFFHFQDRYIKCAATKIIYGINPFCAFIQPIC